MLLNGNKPSVFYFKADDGQIKFLRDATTAELERGILALKKRRKAEEEKENFENEIAAALNNVRLLIQMELLSADDAEGYRLRIKEAQESFYEYLKNSEGNLRGLEGGNTMEAYRRMIAQERERMRTPDGERNDSAGRQDREDRAKG